MAHRAHGRWRAQLGALQARSTAGAGVGGRPRAAHADYAYDKAAQLGFVKPHLGHLMAVLEIDQGRVGTLAAVGYEAEIETWRA